MPNLGMIIRAKPDVFVPLIESKIPKKPVVNTVGSICYKSFLLDIAW